MVIDSATHRATTTAQRPRETRIVAQMEVRITDAQLASPALETDSLNFSLGGLCARSQRDYAVGHPVNLEIMLGGERVYVRGIVAWIRPHEAVGIRFVEMPQDIEERLEALVWLLAAVSA